MRKILIVDDLAIVRDPIAATLRGAGYEAVCAATGAQAIKLLRSEHPDLVLLDIHLPEMSGLDLLKTMRSTPETSKLPVILLTGDETRDCVLQAGKLGVQGYLLKSQFSLPELLARVGKFTAGPNPPGRPVAAAPSVSPIPPRPDGSPKPLPLPAAPDHPDLKQILTRQECTARVEKVLNVKTLSGAVAEVIALAASPRGDVSQLATLLGRDAVLSARVLGAANSAAYASKRGVVATLADAVRQIGSSAVRNIALTVGIFDAMPPSEADGFGPIRCWQHSLAVARLCERLAGNLKEAAAPAYLAGLCHDLGEISFRTHFASEYAQVLEAQRRTAKRRDEVERIMLGLTHNQIVATILRSLKLPDAVRRPIEDFHAHAAGGRLADPVARLLRIANEYAKGLLLTSSSASCVSPITRAECAAATGQRDPSAPSAAEFTNAIRALTFMLARLPPAREAELNKPLFPRSDARIWLARDPAFSAFCPVTAALQEMAQVDLHDRLPSAKEITDHQGLVVLSCARSTAGFTIAEIEHARALVPERTLRTLWLAGGAADRAAAPEETSVHLLTIPVRLDQLGSSISTMLSGRNDDWPHIAPSDI